MTGLYLNPSWRNLLNGSLPTSPSKSPSCDLRLENLRKAWSLLESLKRLLEGEPAPLKAPGLETPPAPSFLDSETFAQWVKSDLQRQIDTIEPATQKRLDSVNAKRAKKGKAPVDFMKTTQEIEGIMNDPGLTDTQKKDKIDEIRKRLGLGKGDMKALFTKRLGRIYGEAARQIQNRLNLLKEAVKQAEKIYSKGSAQAERVRETLAAAQSSLQPTLDDLKHRSGLYNSLYPSFWSRLGGFFKSIGKAFLKVGQVFTKIMNFISPFLRLIPVYGQMISLAWSALKSFVSLVKGNWRGILGNLLSSANITGLGGIFGGVSKLASKIAFFGKGLFQAFQGNIGGIFRMGLGGLAQISPIGDLFHRSANSLRRLISPLRETESPGA